MQFSVEVCIFINKNVIHMFKLTWFTIFLVKLINLLLPKYVILNVSKLNLIN